MEKSSRKNLADLMQKRQISLPDRRYLIFYDFAETPAEEAEDTKSEPHPEIEATEEKNV